MTIKTNYEDSYDYYKSIAKKIVNRAKLSDTENKWESSKYDYVMESIARTTHEYLNDHPIPTFGNKLMNLLYWNHNDYSRPLEYMPDLEAQALKALLKETDGCYIHIDYCTPSEEGILLYNEIKEGFNLSLQGETDNIQL